MKDPWTWTAGRGLIMEEGYRLGREGNGGKSGTTVIV